jgi:hypothetical protein
MPKKPARSPALTKMPLAAKCYTQFTFRIYLSVMEIIYDFMRQPAHSFIINYFSHHASVFSASYGLHFNTHFVENSRRHALSISFTAFNNELAISDKSFPWFRLILVHLVSWLLICRRLIRMPDCRCTGEEFSFAIYLVWTVSSAVT